MWENFLFVHVHILVLMSSKTISLREEAYHRLKLLKDEKGGSFSDVVIELTEDSEKDFSNIVGADMEVSWEDVEESRKRFEEDDRREELLSRH